MFSSSKVVLKRAVSAYGVFMKKVKNHPDLKACGADIKKRGKLTAKMYHKLSAAEKAKLAAEGKRRA